jgi:hypothetical protein
VNFQPELAAAVMAGSKTVTRRLVSDNPRSPWWRERCSLRVGRTYAVCPGRGKAAIGRVWITGATRMRLGCLSEAEARREGFEDAAGFAEAWALINGGYDAHDVVWRVAFEPVWA